MARLTCRLGFPDHPLGYFPFSRPKTVKRGHLTTSKRHRPPTPNARPFVVQSASIWRVRLLILAAHADETIDARGALARGICQSAAHVV